MKFFDSHAHYNDSRFEEDRDDVIKMAYKENITKILNAGYSIKASEKAIEIANKYEFIYASVGISPNDLEDLGEAVVIDDIKVEEKEVIKTINMDYLYKLTGDKKVVAIGEIGLDYYWNKENKELQKDMFKKQIELANKCKLPIIIHSRDAYIDTIDIIKNQVKCEKAGVFHCCPLNLELVKDAINLGYYISFAGPITFKNTKNAEEIIRYVPLDKMLIETDCPYLSPEPKRGQRNDSINVKHIAEKIAQVKGVSLEEIAEITYKNACKLFEIN